MNTDSYKNLKDEELIHLIVKDGNPELFQLLYTKYYQKVLDKSYSLLKNKKLAEDFATDILSKAYEKLGGFKGMSSFSSWLYAITYNYCIDYLREKKKLHYPEWNSKNEIPEIIDETEDEFPEVSYDRLMEVIEMIHPEEKALIIMKYQDNLTMKEIGAALRITEDATKMRLKRARSRVLYLYKKTYPDN